VRPLRAKRIVHNLVKGNSMSKLIRTTTVKSRSTDSRRGKSPIWTLSEGEIYILQRVKGAAIWTLATERDFGVKTTVAANEALFFNNPDNH
jgi:hypothetical protein